MIACQPLADHLRLFPYWTPPTVPMPVLIYGQHEEDWRCLGQPKVCRHCGQVRPDGGWTTVCTRWWYPPQGS
jgi:hypothetical protein